MLDLLAKNDGNLQMPDLIEGWTPMNFVALSRAKMTIRDQEFALSSRKESPAQYLKTFYSSCESHYVNNLTTSEIQYLFEFWQEGVFKDALSGEQGPLKYDDVGFRAI